VARPARLKFLAGEIPLGSLSFPSVELDGPFDAREGAEAGPAPPFDRFPDGVEVVKVPSLPISERLPRLTLLPGCIRYVPAQYRRFVVDLRGLTFEDYLGKFSSKSRANLRKKVRRFAEHSGGAVAWREFRRPEEMAEFHRLARRVSERTYQERLLRSGLPDGAEFLGDLQRRAALDQVRGYLLSHGDRPVAYLHCPARGEDLLYAHVGHDPEYNPWSPGTVLIYHALERLFAEGRFRLLDFTEGEGEHKAFFATRGVLCADVYYFRRRPRHLAVLGLHSGLQVSSRAAAGLLDAIGLKRRVKKLLRARS
jgi:CelD/BcsL family acetyltransferase involved in cellulose biosynthesis